MHGADVSDIRGGELGTARGWRYSVAVRAARREILSRVDPGKG